MKSTERATHSLSLEVRLLYRTAMCRKKRRIEQRNLGCALLQRSPGANDKDSFRNGSQDRR